MTKLLKLFSFMFLVSTGLLAQSTTVSGNVTDLLGNVWINARVIFQFQPTPNTPGPYTWSGGTLNLNPQTVITDGSGNFSISLASNTAIVPSLSSYLVSVCPDTTIQCVVFQTPVTGATLNLTSLIHSSFVTINVAATFIAKAYNINMVGTVPLNEGAMIYNTTLMQLEYWNGSIWQALASGGSAGCTSANCVITNPVGPQTITQPANTNFNVATSGTGQLQHNGNAVLDVTTGLQLNPPGGSQSVSGTTTFQHLGDFVNATCTSWRGLINVKDCGAKGDGVTDDTTAIQAALNLVASGGTQQYHQLYFPCGTYITSAQLTLTNAPLGVAPYLNGENVSCVNIQYTGIATITAVFEATSGASNNWGAGLSINNMSFYGNANVTYDLYVFNQAQYTIANVSMWGANTTTGQCMNINSAVAATITNPVCHPGLGTPSPHDGFVIDGLGATLASVPLILLSPDVVNIPGKALWLKNVNGAQISGCQFSNNGIELYMENTASQNHIDTCLFEGFTLGSVPQTANSRIAGTANLITNSQFTSDASFATEVAFGTGNILQGDYFAAVSGQNLFIDLGVASTTLISDKTHAGLAGISDQGTGTSMVNMKSDNPGDQITQDSNTTFIVPAVNWNGGGANVKDTTTMLHGSFPFGTSAAVLSPTIFSVGHPWKAIFIGTWQEFNGATSSQTIPPYLELSDLGPSITMPSGGVVTFSVNSGGHFQAISTTSLEIFQGFIFFIPNLSGGATTSQVFEIGLPSGAKIGSYSNPAAGACANGSIYTSTTGGATNILWVCGGGTWQLIH